MNRNALGKVKTKMQRREAKGYLEYSQAGNQVQWACRKAIKDYEKSIVMEGQKNPKSFNTYARSKMSKRHVTADLIGPTEAIANIEADKARVLNGFISSAFTSEDTANIP